MKLSQRAASLIIEAICYLYVLLFVYASLTKLLDYDNFQVQLGQSPLLSIYAGWIAFLVPVSELILAALLLFPRFRLWGLFGSYSLMLMFTAYIYIILNYSSFVPCSCGGILEKMNWNQHMLFNSVYILLALAGIFLLPGQAPKSRTL